MADPGYIVAGTLTDGEAWVALKSDVLTGTAESVTWTDPSDGSSLDWCQYMDFVVVWFGRNNATSGGSYFKIAVNAEATGTMNYQELVTEGTTGASSYAYTGYTNSVSVARMAGDIAGVNTASFAAGVVTMFDVNSGKWVEWFGQGGWRSGTTTADQSKITLIGVTYAVGEPVYQIIVRQNPALAGTPFIAGCRFDLFGILPRMVS